MNLGGRVFITRRLMIFLLFTFTLSIIAWAIAAALCNPGGIFEQPVPVLIFFIIGGCSPAICAFIVEYITEGKDGVVNLARRCTKVRIGLWWLALGFMFALGFLQLLLAYVFTGGRVTWIPGPWIQILLFLPIMIAGGGLEEPGWRGLAIEEMQHGEQGGEGNASVSALLLGVIWSCWHIPLWFVPFSNQANLNFGLFLIQVTALAFILAWIYNNTRSTLLCILYHAVVNAVASVWLFNIVPTVSVDLGMEVALFLAWLVTTVGGAAILVIFFGHRTLTKSGVYLTD